MLMIAGLNTATGQDYVTYGLYGRYEEDPKSYFLRVQFNFIDADAPNEDATWWKVGGYVLADEAQKGLDNLNQAFNPHGVFFLADEPTTDCATPATYRTYFDLQNPQGLSVLELIRGGYQTENEVKRALNIYVSSDQGPTGGWAFQVPSNHVALNGNEDGKLATNTTTAVHEVGHALGLLHTFAGEDNGECNEGVVPAPAGNCLDEQDFCYCCGDYVCDTDYDLNEDFELDPTDCTGAESIPPSVRRNYMNYISPDKCRNAFTEQQGLRMKMYLRELKDYYSDDVLEKIQLQEAAYPGTAPSGVTGNLTVEAEVLEILSPLQMLPGATITVKTGAALHIKSTLTSACDEMWQGIKVESGGIVKVFGQGVIEHAVCGIDVVGNSSEVSILGGTLMNNTIGLRVDADDAIETSNQVFFANFELNDQYKGASDERPYFMVLRGNRGTRIRYTTFADERTADCSAPSGACPKRAIGIDAREAGFFCRANTTFSKLYQGIRVSNLSIQQGSFAVSNCTFSKNTKGIVSRFCSSFEIQDNLFEMDSDEHPTYFNAELPIDKSCIEILGAAQGFTVSGNTFVLFGEELSKDCRYYGTICTVTGHGLDNEIINNDYVSMEVGNAARFNNGNEENGLVYLCNDFLAEPPGFAPGPENCVDILIEPGGTIRKEQHGRNQVGDVTPAGNIFASSISNQSGVGQNNSYEVIYYFKPGAPSQNPGPSPGVTLSIPEVQEVYCGPAPCSPPCPQDPIIIKARFEGAGFRRDSLLEVASGLSGAQKEEAERQSRLFEQERRRAAGQILRYYALDTVAVEADSIRQWLENTRTFGSLYLLAREEFFFGDMPFFQVLWARIPQLVALTPYQSGTYSSLSALFSALSPHVSEGGDLSNMPKPLVEALYNFTTHCNEAGFLAVELLRRNGVEAAVQCNSQSPAMAQKNSGGPQAKELRHRQDRISAAFFPNPTQGTLQVVLPEGADQASLILYNLQGQPAFQSLLTGQRTTLQLPVPAGIYWARLQIAGQQPVHHKIIVSR